MNPLAFLASGANSLIAILITAVLSLLGGAYLGHSYEKNYYEAQIAKGKEDKIEIKNIQEQISKINPELLEEYYQLVGCSKKCE